MTWLIWGIVIFLVLAAVGIFGEKSSESPRSKKTVKRQTSIDPDARIRDIVDETLRIVANTKKRAVAESRLKVASEALDDLVKVTKEDRTRRNLIRSAGKELESRFPAKPERASAMRKPETPANNKAQREAVMRRLRDARESPLHEWIRWIAVIDPSTHTACRELDGQVLHRDDPALKRVIKRHFDAGYPECRCRIVAISDRDQ